MTDCPRCALGDYERKKRPDGIKHESTTPKPSIEQLKEWNSDGGCEASDGCWVEPDGICEHGHVSWLRRQGWI
jgi:hypothetical protein